MIDESTPTAAVTAGARAWLGPAVSVAVGALAAGMLNLGLARVLAVDPVPEADAVVTDAPEASEGDADDAPARGKDAAAEAVAAVDRVPRLTERQYLESILARNLFDPTKIGLKPSEDGGAGGAGGEEEEPLTELNITLTGTIVSEPASYSAAFIVESGQSTAWAYGIGQTVQGAEIVQIEKDRILLRRGGRDEWLRMGAEKTERPTGSAIQGREIREEKVEKVGDSEFVLDRAMVEKQLNDLESLSRMGRALLHRGPDGEYDGYRLSAIRRGSLPDQIGIRNGDIIHSINGIEMNSLEGAMEAYEKLRNEDGLEVEITRRGRSEKLSYSIR